MFTDIKMAKHPMIQTRWQQLNTPKVITMKEHIDINNLAAINYVNRDQDDSQSPAMKEIPLDYI